MLSYDQLSNSILWFLTKYMDTNIKKKAKTWQGVHFATPIDVHSDLNFSFHVNGPPLNEYLNISFLSVGNQMIWLIHKENFDVMLIGLIYYI